jgi:ssDNA-binding Zn-finger/Zn-ribbon topoisomerase 1
MENQCPRCNKGLLKLREGKYGQFYGCSNYPNCKFVQAVNSQPYQPNKTLPEAQNSPTRNPNAQDGILLMVDEVKALNENFDKRMDAMSAYLVTEISEIKKIFKENLGIE